jgi:chromosome segregation ATPase|tara:strand:+ start:1668 stop:2006 length:339 start_codon:yes stop_codon:yes gene_type:complete
MQNISLDHINPSDLKNFLRKICIVSSRHVREDKYLGTATKEMLRARVQELEKELRQIREEKDSALKENRDKINELNIDLLSIKTKINELLQAKKEKEMRVKNLEIKLRKNSS